MAVFGAIHRWIDLVSHRTSLDLPCKEHSCLAPGRTLVCMRARILNLTFGTHALKVKGQKATFMYSDGILAKVISVPGSPTS